MKITINRNNFLIFICSSICMLFFWFYLPETKTNSSLWYSSSALYIIALFIVQFVFLKFVIPKKRFILFLVFVLYYLFNFSQVVLHAISYKMDASVESVSIFRYYSAEIPEATVIALKASIGLFIGYMLFFAFTKTEQKCKTAEDVKMPISKNLMIALVIFGGLFDIVSSIINIYLSKIGGYGNTLSIEIPYPIRLCSYLLLPGIILLLSSDDITRQKKKVIFLSFILYKVGCMMSGYRAYSLISIIIAFYYFYRTVYQKKLSLMNYVYGLLIVHIGGGILVGVRNNRDTGITASLIFSSILSPSSNIILNMISEFGITLNVLCVAVSVGSLERNAGGQLFTSILSIIPGIRSIFPGIDYDAQTMDTALGIRGLGGSYVGDLYFDFGYDCLLFSAIILGIVFAIVYEHYERDISEGRCLKVAMVTPIIVELIFCVRSSLAKMPRMIVWYLLTFGAFKIIFTGIRRRQL